MLNRIQTYYFSTNINSFVALVFVGSFALGVGLVVWHAAIGNNPIADFLAQASVTNSLAQ